MVSKSNALILLMLMQCIFFISCDNNNDFSLKYGGLELHRKLIIEEYYQVHKVNKNDDLRKDLEILFNLEYTIPDSIQSTDPRMIYINENPELPDFITKALFEKRGIEFMSVGEFYLAHYKQAHKFRTSFPRPRESYASQADIISIGYSKYFDEKRGLFHSGSYWEFKNGFLWMYGEI